VILSVDDDPTVSRSIDRDLRRRYAERYRVLRAESGAQGLDLIGQVKLRGDAVALIISDQRMPELDGISFLEQAIDVAPEARRVLLTAYADTQAAIDAINTVSLDHYLLKPWEPPAEELYPVLDDLLGDWQAGVAEPEHAIRVIGHRFSVDSHEVRDFLSRNQVPYRWLDLDRNPEAQRLLKASGASVASLPLVFLADGTTLTAPARRDLAQRVGLATEAEHPFYDLAIVGGGPAGLAAAVYGASEGLRTVLVEHEAPGGQAGQSSRIENYLGFPSGLSGADLSRRAATQAQRFGAELITTQNVTAIDANGPSRTLHLADGTQLGAHAVVVATGVAYKTLDVAGIEKLSGRGAYYGAARSEAPSCTNEEVFIVGGANSAGQAALYFAQYARKVTILYRGESLSKSMSSYLIDQIDAVSSVAVRTLTEVKAVHGSDRLETITLSGPAGEETVPAHSLFVLIGAAPHTEWLATTLARDEFGFILTGRDAATVDSGAVRWPLDRAPYMLETTTPGVFAAGDVRHDSIKRVASAVGEGSMAVQFVHQYMAALE
jgi:thioredoxin reductase (NADPH)